MADRTESSSSMVTQQGMSERNRVTTGAGSARSVVAEFMDAARSTAESRLEEQKQQIAERGRGVAEALETAARSLDGSQDRIVARYVEQAGDQVRTFSHSLHGRRWNEIVADTEDFARRQPTLFVLGAVLAVIPTYYVSIHLPRVYEAHAKLLLVAPDSPGDPSTRQARTPCRGGSERARMALVARYALDRRHRLQRPRRLRALGCLRVGLPRRRESQR